MRILTAQELKKKMEEVANLVVVNVLSSDDFKDCHITSSINVPLADLPKKAAEWQKHKEIVVYCAHDQCPLSKHAYEALIKLGFQQVFCYEGGIKDWKKKGLPTQGPCAHDYLKK